MFCTASVYKLRSTSMNFKGIFILIKNVFIWCSLIEFYVRVLKSFQFEQETFKRKKKNPKYLNIWPGFGRRWGLKTFQHPPHNKKMININIVLLLLLLLITKRHIFRHLSHYWNDKIHSISKNFILVNMAYYHVFQCLHDQLQFHTSMMSGTLVAWKVNLWLISSWLATKTKKHLKTLFLKPHQGNGQF